VTAEIHNLADYRAAEAVAQWHEDAAFFYVTGPASLWAWWYWWWTDLSQMVRR